MEHKGQGGGLQRFFQYPRSPCLGKEKVNTHDRRFLSSLFIVEYLPHLPFSIGRSLHPPGPAIDDPFTLRVV